MSLVATPPTPLAVRRFTLGFSQADLAEATGLSRETISRIERGELPHLRTAQILAACLGVEIADIFPTTSEAPAANEGFAKNGEAPPHARV